MSSCRLIGVNFCLENGFKGKGCSAVGSITGLERAQMFKPTLMWIALLSEMC